MVRNRISNNIDLVQPTQYIIPKNLVVKKLLLEPALLPHFNPLPIYNKNKYSQLKLPANIDNNDPLQLFKLFQTDKWIDRLMEYTNGNAELYHWENIRRLGFKSTLLSAFRVIGM